MARELKQAPLLDAAEAEAAEAAEAAAVEAGEADPELTRSNRPFTGGDGRPSEPDAWELEGWFLSFLGRSNSNAYRLVYVVGTCFLVGRGSQDLKSQEAGVVSKERIQIMIQAAAPANLAPTTSHSLLHSLADAPHGSDEGPLAGLTSEEAQQRLLQYGRNEIPEHVTCLAFGQEKDDAL